MADRLYVSSVILTVSPPWLRRSVGGKLMQAFGDVIDDLITRTAQSVSLRFPTDAPDPGALVQIGKDRRIRRGINEPALTYARRVRRWLDDHRTRGNTHALLRQLYAYLGAVVPGPYVVISSEGVRHTLAVDGVTITRDVITWDPGTNIGGTGWARLWIFLDVGTDPGALTEDQKEVYRVIPREWVAAHIYPTTIVLLYGSAFVWGYPSPARNWGGSGAVWGQGGSREFYVEQ